MGKYEQFSETAHLVFMSNKSVDDQVLTEINDMVGNEISCNGTDLVILCKENDVLFTVALTLCLKAEFEAFAGNDTLKVYGIFGVELYQLAETAGQFELFSPAIEKICADVAKVYCVDRGVVAACSIEIIHNRFYLYDGIFFVERLDTMLKSKAVLSPQIDSHKYEIQLREKIALEKSCEIKSIQIIEAKAIAMEIRSEFLNRFPGYLKEFVAKTKVEILKAINTLLDGNKKIDDLFYKTQAEHLCDQAGLEREMKNELSAGRFERYASRSIADQEMTYYFHRELTNEIMMLLRYAHPDKIKKGISNDELAKQIAENSCQLVKFRELSRLGPGILTFRLMNELQSWKKEFALLHPEAAEEVFSKDKNHPIEKEIMFWEASEKFLSEELESFLTNNELANMRAIMDAPDMHEEYEKLIGNSIIALNQSVEQLLADPQVKQPWEAILLQAGEMTGNSQMIKELFE